MYSVLLPEVKRGEVYLWLYQCVLVQRGQRRGGPGPRRGDTGDANASHTAIKHQSREKSLTGG